MRFQNALLPNEGLLREACLLVGKESGSYVSKALLSWRHYAVGACFIHASLLVGQRCPGLHQREAAFRLALSSLAGGVGVADEPTWPAFPSVNAVSVSSLAAWHEPSVCCFDSLHVHDPL